MKRTLKVLICFIMTVVLSMSMIAYAATYSAVVPTFDVLVNGERFYSEPPVIVIDGSTYLPLRALGDALDVYVEWDTENGQVEVSTTKEVLPKEPEVANSYDSFTDIPDFGKLTELTAIATESVVSDFGYITSYAYEIPDDNLEAIVTTYFEALMILGYEEYYYDNSQGYETILLLGENGRMLNLVNQGNIFVVSVFEQKHTEEEWTILDSGQTLPAKEYDAVTAGFKVMVDGEEFVSEKPALVVDGRTYLPLRTMGDCLGVNVEWNSEIGRVEVTK